MLAAPMYPQSVKLTRSIRKPQRAARLAAQSAGKLTVGENCTFEAVLPTSPDYQLREPGKSQEEGHSRNGAGINDKNAG